MTTTIAQAAATVATDIAWNGSASDAWIAQRIAREGLPLDAADVIRFALSEGLIRPIPRIGGYTATRKVNADTFGERYAEWVAGQ